MERRRRAEVRVEFRKALALRAIGGPQPEPPEIFSANVQALVYAVDTEALAEVAVGDTRKNLNVQIAVETAAPPPSLDKTFANDIVAIDANLAGDTFLIVSRGGNQVFRANSPIRRPASSTS
jgi:hypothetical protein